MTSFEWEFYSECGAHQLQLKRDTCGPHELYTYVFVISHAITLTIYYLYVQSYVHAYSSPLYMQGFILHTHACAGCDAHHHHMYFYRLVTARPSYARNRL